VSIRTSFMNQVRPWFELSSIAETSSKRSGATWVDEAFLGMRWRARRFPCRAEKSPKAWKASVGGRFSMTNASVVSVWPGTRDRRAG